MNCPSNMPRNTCPSFPDTKCIVYSGTNLSCIGVNTNDRLDAILVKINEVVCDGLGTNENFANTDLTSTGDRVHDFTDDSLTIEEFTSFTLQSDNAASQIVFDVLDGYIFRNLTNTTPNRLLAQSSSTNEVHYATVSTGLQLNSGALTATLSTGLAGGQTAYGGTAAGEDLTLSSTLHATRGDIILGTTVYDEVNNRLRLAGIADQGAYDLQLDGNLWVGASNIDWFAGANPTRISGIATQMDITSTTVVIASQSTGSVILNTPGGIAMNVLPTGTAFIPQNLVVGRGGGEPSAIFDFIDSLVNISVDRIGSEFASTATFDTLGGALINYLARFNNTGTRTVGANTLTNVAALFTSASAQLNYSIWAEQPLVIRTGEIPAVNQPNAFTLYSNDITAGNAAPHIRTENGDIIRLYQETTAVAAATFTANAGTAVNDASTFDGYTLGQIVAALRNLGILA
jgi:hypothetical protein